MSSSTNGLVRAKGLRDKQETALSALRGGSSFPQAAEAAGVARATVYRWMQSDPHFRAAYNAWRASRRRKTMRMSSIAMTRWAGQWTTMMMKRSRMMMNRSMRRRMRRPVRQRARRRETRLTPNPTRRRRKWLRHRHLSLFYMRSHETNDTNVFYCARLHAPQTLEP